MVSTIPNFAFLTQDASPSYVAVPSRFTRAAARNGALLLQCGQRACVHACMRACVPACAGAAFYPRTEHPWASARSGKHDGRARDTATEEG